MSEIPPLRPKQLTSWAGEYILPILLILISAWTLGSYYTSKIEIINLQDEVIEMRKLINQNTTWLRQVQDEHKAANLASAEALAKINLQLAEIKGATNARARTK